MIKHNKFHLPAILSFAGLILPLSAPVAVHAQGLEEIIVTAQRREQSLQEVPISIETYSGAEITKQGYRDMQDLVNFSPTVTVQPDILRSSITIRGFGAAQADALTIEQSSPTFVDGIHYGRTSQIKLAFLDLQGVEILKGPQPVYFGQNAIAGAFNLTTRKPTPEWEGYLNGDIGNNNSQKVEAAAGGPITDTLGFRVAGSFERSDGYLKDIVIDEKFPRFKNFGGRAILQWSPTNNFQATLKAEVSDQNKGAQGNHVCYQPNGVFAPLVGGTIPIWEGSSVLLDPEQGGRGWSVNHKTLGDCYASNDGLLTTDKFPPPNGPTNFVVEGTQTILLNTIGTERFITGVTTDKGFRENREPYSYESRENIEPWNTYLNLTYTLENGIELTSLTGYDYYYREYLRDNRGSPFLANQQNREEDQYSISQEVRISSPTGGTFEWMVGGYWQDVDYDIFSDSVRPNNRTGRRYNEAYEDATWKSIFGNLTYNFFDNKASIDLGARYSNSKKETFVQSYGAQWIMFDGFVFPWNQRAGPDSSAAINANCGVGISCLAAFNLYNGTAPIGMTPLATLPQSQIPGPYLGAADQTELDPQIVLRYRPTDTMSMYAKYATSFKAAGFNTGQATLPGTLAEYGFGPEYGTNYEAGVKGDLLDGRARYTLAVFNSKTTDLQLASAVANPDNALLNFQNAGAQRVRGAELTIDWLPTDRLSLSLSSALLDGVMLDYRGASCTEAEFNNLAESGCVPNAAQPTNGALATIDRSGTQAPNTPDWKIVLDADYTMPLFIEGYEASFNAKGYMSDGYITNSNTFDQVNKFNQHEDLSVQVGFGPQDGPWQLSFYSRNILEPHESYNQELDYQPPSPVSTPVVYKTNYMSYGMTFRYSYD